MVPAVYMHVNQQSCNAPTVCSYETCFAALQEPPGALISHPKYSRTGSIIGHIEGRNLTTTGCSKLQLAHAGEKKAYDIRG